MQVPIQGNREYDVHLDAPPLEIPAHWTKRDLKRWTDLTAKRIDMVVHGQETIWIMEITPKVSKAAIGGCLAYKDLYVKQFQPEKEVKCGIIVEVDDQAYHSTLKNNNISLWVV